MNPVQYIRKAIFNKTQAEFADLLNVSQSSVSRWEENGYFPPEHQPRIRELGRAICDDGKLAWNDSWFFEVPITGREAAE